jgi:hypothetical protein
MTARRLKSLTLLAGALASSLTLLAWTQEWFHLTLRGTDTAISALTVTGSTAAPALSALSLAGLALLAALAISGPIVRVACGILQTAIGVAVVSSSVAALQAPVASTAAAVTKATGVSGTTSVTALVASVGASAWPWVAIGLGIFTALIGSITVFTTRRWPGATRRYDPVGTEKTEHSPNPVSDWDELSGGSDPTSR